MLRRLLLPKPLQGIGRQYRHQCPKLTAHIDSSGNDGLSNAPSAILFSVALFTSLRAISTLVDPDPAASFRQLIALPSDTAHEAPHIDPRRMRTIVDRGVVRYASAKTDKDRVIGARLIQAAALVGFSPARDILARNYPQSEAVRSVVPANDAIRYALVPLMDVTAMSEKSSEYSSPWGSISPFKDRWICSPAGSSIYCAATRAATRLSDRHAARLASARARGLQRARPPDTGRQRGSRPRMFFQPKAAQICRSHSAGL